MDILNYNRKHLYLVGLNFRKADLQVRSSFSISTENQKYLLIKAKQLGLDGITVLSTCNRTEILGFSNHPFQLLELMCEFSEGKIGELVKVAYILKRKEVVNHLFRIGTGLDSQIIGDYEIAGQLRKSFLLSKDVGTSHPYLERLFNALLQASKRVKNETLLSSGTTSVAYATVQNLQKIAKDTDDILVFGLGEIGKNVLKNIETYTDLKNITLINRTLEKSNLLHYKFDFVDIQPIEKLSEQLNKTRFLIVGTSSENYTVKYTDIDKNNHLVIFDLSVPSNVDPKLAENPFMEIINVDELSKMTEETIKLREKQIPLAEKIIEEVKSEFSQWVDNRKFAPLIQSFKEKLENIQKTEIKQLVKKDPHFNIDDATLATDKVLQKVINNLAVYLKNHGNNENIDLIKEVFDLKIKKEIEV